MTSHNEKQTNQTKNTPHNQKPTHNHQNLVIPEKVKRWDNPGSQWVCKNPGSQTFFSDKYIRRMPRCNAFHRSTFTSLGKREMHIAMPEHCLASLLSFSFQVEYSCRFLKTSLGKETGCFAQGKGVHDATIPSCSEDVQYWEGARWSCEPTGRVQISIKDVMYIDSLKTWKKLHVMHLNAVNAYSSSSMS